MPGKKKKPIQRKGYESSYQLFVSIARCKRAAGGKISQEGTEIWPKNSKRKKPGVDRKQHSQKDPTQKSFEKAARKARVRKNRNVSRSKISHKKAKTGGKKNRD